MIAIIQVAMRHSKEDKAASHERIVEVAAARIRESGTEQPGVAEIMRAAGLTHGGFYKHFGSRDELIAEAVERALADSEPRLVEIAARRFRESGTTGPGVAELMQEAGLTHGGFYKHFGSRDDLVGVGDVELRRHEPRIGVADGRDVAHSGVDLGRAALKQRVNECLADPAVGAGDERDGSFDLHGGLHGRCFG